MIIHKPSLGSRDVLHKIWARSVQRFIGYKQTNIQTDKPNLYIDFLTLPLKNLNIFFSPQPMKRVRCKFQLNSLKNKGTALKKTRAENAVLSWSLSVEQHGGKGWYGAPSFYDWSNCNFKGKFSMTRPRFSSNFKKIGTLFFVCPSVRSWASTSGGWKLQEKIRILFNIKSE